MNLFVNINFFLNFLYTLNSYAREYADPYLGHGIGPVPGYGVSFSLNIKNEFKYLLIIVLLVFTGHNVSRRIQSLYTLLNAIKGYY